jgi:hypothetical protein
MIRKQIFATWTGILIAINVVAFLVFLILDNVFKGGSVAFLAL